MYLNLLFIFHKHLEDRIYSYNCFQTLGGTAKRFLLGRVGVIFQFVHRAYFHAFSLTKIFPFKKKILHLCYLSRLNLQLNSFFLGSVLFFSVFYRTPYFLHSIYLKGFFKRLNKENIYKDGCEYDVSHRLQYPSFFHHLARLGYHLEV